MPTWNVHLAFDVPLGDDEREVISSSLAGYVAKVSSQEGRLHVDLMVQAHTAVEAGLEAAMRASYASSRDLNDPVAIEVVSPAEAARRLVTALVPQPTRAEQDAR